MQRVTFLLIFVLVSNFSLGQRSFLDHDSIPNKPRTIGTSVGVAAAWGGSIAGLASVWYKDSWGGGFKLFNDGAEWLQMDKAGHAYTGNHLTRNIYQLYRWSGQSKNTSLLIGSGVSFGYLATFEILDGFSEDWGFSWWDLVANTAGVAWFTAQELIWNEQRLKLKFSASLSPYARYRPEVLGNTTPERILKDYNGQTYWLNFNPSQFHMQLPTWLSFSFGYSIDQKLHGFEYTYHYVDPINWEYKTFRAQRQFLLSLDIDLERIPVKQKWLKTTFSLLNHLKIPFPALMYSNGQFTAHPFYF